MKNIKISDVEDAFKEIFADENGVVKSISTIYEKSDDKDFLKLIISIHGLATEDISIIHTKFIFKVG